jgi:hypothetical protein
MDSSGWQSAEKTFPKQWTDSAPFAFAHRRKDKARLEKLPDWKNSNSAEMWRLFISESLPCPQPKFIAIGKS